MKLKSKILSLVALGAVIINGCGDGNTETKAKATNSFDKNTGAKLQTDVAARWMQRTNASGSRSSQFTLTKSAIAVAAKDGNLGVALHHALDESGNYTLLAVVVGPDSKLWTSSMIVNTSTGETIDNVTAHTWAKNYMTANTGKIRYHFSGVHVFESILATAGMNHVSLEAVINDDGQPQILMVVWGANTGGRIQSDPLDVYDFTAPCPNTCPSGDN
ncbi:hypothetical protein WSM22_33560 [Cytophagales bacterium WSM2-2]|nr:hypothetical protein WSM22_33560 [Cytophagales bacterium WSM2-2]